MKAFVLSCFIIGVLAEPPRSRPARYRLQRLELTPTTTDPPTESTTETESPSTGGPYPPSGWKPSGEPFTLPDRKAETPADTYGAPLTNGPYPPSGWKPDGPAFNLPGDEVPEGESTENPQAEKLEGPVEVQKSVGTYYVLLPNGQLQKVEFLTENDIQNMRYTARLQLQDRAPLYVFGP